MGVNRSSPHWFFAEGAAASGFETFYVVFNPHATPVTVQANFFTEAHGHIQRAYYVGPGQRQTIYLNGEFGPIGGTAVSLLGATGFIAERSIYWGAGRVDGTNVFGSMGVANRWDLPEGAAGGNFDTFLLLGNPFDDPTTVDISVQIEGYGQITLPPSMRKLVGARSRLTLYMPQVLREAEVAAGLPPGALANASFSTTVRVVGGPAIVAEHAVYWRRDGANYWRAGSASFGIPR